MTTRFALVLVEIRERGGDSFTVAGDPEVMAGPLPVCRRRSAAGTVPPGGRRSAAAAQGSPPGSRP
jgi:hypothetical protein